MDSFTSKIKRQRKNLKTTKRGSSENKHKIEFIQDFCKKKEKLLKH